MSPKPFFQRSTTNGFKLRFMPGVGGGQPFAPKGKNPEKEKGGYASIATPD